MFETLFMYGLSWWDVLFFVHVNLLWFLAYLAKFKTIFATVNKKIYTSEWFKENKLSLNNTKTKYSFFHTSQRKNDIYAFSKIP